MLTETKPTILLNCKLIYSLILLSHKLEKEEIHITFKKISLLLALLCFSFVQAITLKAEEKYNWAQKIIMPLENTEVYTNQTYNFERYNLVTGPAKKGEKNSIIKIEGKKSTSLYKACKG